METIIFKWELQIMYLDGTLEAREKHVDMRSVIVSVAGYKDARNRKFMVSPINEPNE